MDHIELLYCERRRRRCAKLRFNSSSGPSISVSGVRNSWLTFEKKAVLARSISASASARLRSSSYPVHWRGSPQSGPQPNQQTVDTDRRRAGNGFSPAIRTPTFPVLIGRHNRHDDGLMRRLFPGARRQMVEQPREIRND